MPFSILVVEDNKAVLEAHISILSANFKAGSEFMQAPHVRGFAPIEIIGVETYDRALGILKYRNIDLLIVDLKIKTPSGNEMGGLEIVERSRKLNPIRPVIVVTGFGNIKLARNTFKSGVFDFIEKGPNSHRILLDSVQKAIEHKADIILRSSNPFIPGAGQEPTVFGGRIHELDFFYDRLNRAVHADIFEHFVILGDAGTGKSALMGEYKKLAYSCGNLASVIALEPLEKDMSLLQASKSIISALIRDLNLPVKRLRNFLEYLNSIGVDVAGFGINISWNEIPKDLSPHSFLYDSFSNIWRDIVDKSDILVVMLDDIENVVKLPEILKTLKSTLSMLKESEARILIGIACNPNDWERIIISQSTRSIASYFISHAKLQNLSLGELDDTINRTLFNTMVKFSKEEINGIYSITLGHPLKMQILCHYLFRNKLLGGALADIWQKSLEDAAIQMTIPENKLLKLDYSTESLSLPNCDNIYDKRVVYETSEINIEEFPINVAEHKNSLPIFSGLKTENFFQEFAREFLRKKK